MKTYHLLLQTKVKPDQRVFIHGGSGGVGSMAIQLAKNADAYVITTANGSNKDFLKNLVLMK
ncbi:hypothetical protein [Clostridium sp. BL-8]|uniref:hypothetical protein n=1 Tax=Clostridium sp. BL-8 TaxID=349938 RepID=UPI00098C2E0B|nr:hypothetical protein [Clostridium sp. BL-8]